MPRSRIPIGTVTHRHVILPLTIVSLVAVLLWLPACRAPRFPDRPDLLLITVDTLRADHLGAWGYPRETSPFLDGLAAEGVRFSDAWVQWPKTGPSMASMFTSTYARDNGIVRRVGVPVPGAFRMLAEELQGLGYATHAVVANGALGREFNFQQGFDQYVESWKRAAPEGIDRNGAGRVTDLALEVADGVDGERPYFLWVHYLDPHAPYSPPDAYRDRFQGDDWFAPATEIPLFPDRPEVQMMGIGPKQVLDGRTDLPFYVARYDAEIAYTDRQIERLWEALERRGLLRRTLTAFTSDHGESLGEHRYYFDHGRFGFETCLHVPLILHFPGVLRPRVVERPVELLDLAPTLLEAAGRELPDGAWMQGGSLTRLLSPRLPWSEPAGDEFIFAEAGYAVDDNWQKVVRSGRHKLLLAPWRGANRWIGGRDVLFTLYDLEADPGELTSLVEERPEVFQRLHDALADWLNRPPFPVRLEEGVDASGEMAPETRQLLEALGYL